MASHTLRGIEAKISAGDFYDAQQMVKTVQRRLCLKKQHSASADLCVESARRFNAAGKFDLAADLGKDLVAVFEDTKAEPNAENLGRVGALLEDIPPMEAVTLKYAVLHRALKWSSAFIPGGHPDIHKIAAKSYWAESDYGKCQAHYVFCGDGQGLADMVREWSQLGYTCERDLFALRTLLILLSLEDLSTAHSFWSSMAGSEIASCGTSEPKEDFTVPSAPLPALQFGTFVLTSARARHLEFFRAVRAKYTLVTRRDCTFDKYLDEIEVKVFGAQQQRNGLGAIFEALMGGVGGGGNSVVGT
mmetsp:Transcript_63970/g.169333  ORF Transcript_63970/g.169333 Transcript_63970/m.169333 type:complete len:303 (-) Transcript_63970:39-947(-)